MSVQLVDQTDRLVDRLRAMPAPRLARASDGEPSVADSAHALAQVLADLAADVGGLPRREVPRLTDFSVGDQVAVTLHDLVSAVGDRTHVALTVALVAVEALRDQL